MGQASMAQALNVTSDVTSISHPTIRYNFVLDVSRDVAVEATPGVAPPAGDAAARLIRT